MKPKQITKLRTEMGLSFNEFAALLGCHRSTCQRWEHGQPLSTMAAVALNKLAAEAKRNKEIAA